MATIHKLKKDGSTIYPATITDAIVHQDTGATLTEMMISYNVTQLYPTSGISGGSTYNLSGAITVLASHLTTAEKKVGIHLSFTDSSGVVLEYVYQGGTFTSTSGWVQTGDIYAVPDASGTLDDPDFNPYTDTLHLTSQTLTGAQKAQVITNLSPDTQPLPGSDNLITSGAVASSIVYDVSANNSGATFESLSALLSNANLSTLIPDSVRKGGMSIKFILSPDNKYVQYRYIGTAITGSPNPFLNTVNWQGVDDIPAEGSKNLVESGGVYNFLQNYVSTTQAQNFNDAQKAQARQNIEAMPAMVVDDVPTAESDNLVKSGGVEKKINALEKNMIETINIKDDDSDATLNIGDANGNVVAQFKNGHIKTKNFDSSNINTDSDVDVKDDDSDADLNISDANGNVIAQFKDGHIKTKNFDSGSIVVGGLSNINVAIADFKADVYMIPCYGQSLALNTDAGPSTFNYTEPLSYDVNLNNTNIQDMCAGTAEAFRIMADYYGISLPTNFKIIGSPQGWPGTSIAGLSKGTTYYNNLLAAIQTAKNACDSAGLTMCVPCFTWTQGEEDMRCGGNPAAYGTGIWNPFEYKNKLRTLIENLNSDIKSITGQTCDVLCISYQVASHNAYFRYPRIALQQAELAKEYSRMILAKIMYDVDYNARDYVHAPAKTYRNMGNLYGVAAFNTCVLNLNKRWVHLLDYRITGTKIILRFDVPYPPLVLDDSLINQLPDGNFGFNVYNVDEESGAAGTITKATTIITQVRIIGNDEIEITLNRTPQAGERLTYGINGDYWENIAGTKVVVTGEVDDGTPKSGWLHGARGCLRDSQRIKNNNPGAVFTNLYNWCEIFEIQF